MLFRFQAHERRNQASERPSSGGNVKRTVRVMNAQELLQEISDYCRQTGLAESTFGRRAVNDGKLTNRLRNGGRITTDTLDRIRSFMQTHRGPYAHGRPAVIQRTSEQRPMPSIAAPTSAIQL